MLARRTAILLLIGQHYVMCYTSYCLKLQTQLATWSVSENWSILLRNLHCHNLHVRWGKRVWRFQHLLASTIRTYTFFIKFKIPGANRTEFNQEMQIRFQTVKISIADSHSTVLYGSQTLLRIMQTSVTGGSVTLLVTSIGMLLYKKV